MKHLSYRKAARAAAARRSRGLEPQGLDHPGGTCQGGSYQGFTLIELLVVIAIIGILAAILFPVFATAKEKGRQAVCQSNLKQFMLAIIMYTNDNDEKMPLSISGSAQIGPGTAKLNNVPEFGVHDEISAYVKNHGVFQCPDDNGFKPGGTAPKCGQTLACGGDTIADAYGTSYKFTKENFSIFPSAKPPTGNYNCITGCANTNPKAQLQSGADPPFPMPVGLFLRPTETRVMRCFVAPWEETVAGGGPIPAGKPAVFHPTGEIIAFMDGHVKWCKSLAQENSYCNGPTYSPVRALPPTDPSYNALGDGSCGPERKG